jgi:hypothetical protein
MVEQKFRFDFRKKSFLQKEMNSIFELAGIRAPATDDAKIRFIAEQIRNAKRSPDDVPVDKNLFIIVMIMDLCRKCNDPYVNSRMYIERYMDLDVDECVLPPSKRFILPAIREDVWDGTEFEGLYRGTEIPF